MCRYFSADEFFLIFTNCIILVDMFTYNCIHDEINLPYRRNYYLNYKKVRKKRESNETLIEPLKIHVYMKDIDKKLAKDVLFNVNFALGRVAKYLSETIEVKYSMNPFVLERTSCLQKWRQGLNKGRCSRMKSGPEFCSTKEADFIIPDQFLDKLEIYDNSIPDPVFKINQGTGAVDSNFILFVLSKTTSWCRSADVQAYGTYCRLDENGRPVAGLLNLCPDNFSKKLFKPDHYFNIILHEVFHMLGFSKHLYSKFKTCSSSLDCHAPKRFVIKDRFGIQRLIFPPIVQSMQLHFNCSKEEFGGPLEKTPDSDSLSDFSSHWHPLLMYSSIMTPSIPQEDFVVVDNTTLALLASTGWYKIDFTKAQPFIFGQNGGCTFGFGDSCAKSKYLCTFSNETGCDLSHKTIGKCEKLAPDHLCGIYKPNHKESCTKEEGKLYESDLESSEFNRQCVVLQQSNGSVPACVALNCKTSTSLNLLVSGTMVDCDYKNETQVGINCPNDLSFCLTKGLQLATTFCEQITDKLAISLQLFFVSPTSQELSDPNVSKKFQDQTIQEIASQINIPVNYIVNSSLHVTKSVYLEFVICPPADVSETELNLIVTKTQEFLINSSFVAIFKSNQDVPVASTDMNVDPELSMVFGDEERFRSLFIVPVICGIFVLTTFIASLIRLLMMQRHRPKRENIEIQELSAISVAST